MPKEPQKYTIEDSNYLWTAEREDGAYYRLSMSQKHGRIRNELNSILRLRNNWSDIGAAARWYKAWCGY